MLSLEKDRKKTSRFLLRFLCISRIGLNLLTFESDELPINVFIDVSSENTKRIYHIK